jgi:D-alanyl-D-alanine carboxypeptidase (penicillin-binding protein 5/6)
LTLSIEPVPLTRRQLYRRRRVTVFGVLAVVLGIVVYLPMTLLAPLQVTDPVVAKHAVLPEAAAQLTFPSYGGSAIGAVGFDGVLAQAGSTAPLPMASITKLVTMLVVLQAKPLAVGTEGPSVTMTSSDVSLYNRYVAQNGSVSPVRSGLVFTQHELMELSLVRSADNYAASLAVWAYGSMDAYLAAAKSWVAAHQLPSMTITDPTGIEPTDAASTGDLLTLGKLALADPVIADIVSMKSVTIHDVGTLKNTNGLLGSLGIVGIKTGTLTGAGANLLFASEHKVGGTRVTIVGVVLGGSTHAVIDADITTLMTGVLAGFHEVTLVSKGDTFASYTTRWGQRTAAIAEKSARIVTWSDTAVTSTASVTPVTTGAKGLDVGTATFTVAGRTIRVPLGLKTALTDPGPGWRLSHPGLIVGAP